MMTGSGRGVQCICREDLPSTRIYSLIQTFILSCQSSHYPKGQYKGCCSNRMDNMLSFRSTLHCGNSKSNTAIMTGSGRGVQCRCREDLTNIKIYRMICGPNSNLYSKLIMAYFSYVGHDYASQ